MNESLKFINNFQAINATVNDIGITLNFKSNLI